MTVAHQGAFALASPVLVVVLRPSRVAGDAGGLAMVGTGDGTAFSGRKD
jgi:hypothetical protein